MITQDEKFAFGNKLFELRKKKGLSQEKLIEKIGEEKISLRSYKDYECGKRFPNTEHLIYLSRFYHLPIDNLLEENLIKIPDHTWEEKFRALSILMSDLILVPANSLLPQNKDNENPPKVCFVSYDEELKLFLEKINWEFDVCSHNGENRPITYRRLIKMMDFINLSKKVEVPGSKYERITGARKEKVFFK